MYVFETVTELFDKLDEQQVNHTDIRYINEARLACDAMTCNFRANFLEKVNDFAEAVIRLVIRFKMRATKEELDRLSHLEGEARKELKKWLKAMKFDTNVIRRIVNTLDDYSTKLANEVC